MAVAGLEKVSEGWNDISGDGIRLPNSFHPSDERTSHGFQPDRGRGFLPERMGPGHTDKELLLFLLNRFRQGRLSLTEAGGGGEGPFSSD